MIIIYNLINWIFSLIYWLLILNITLRILTKHRTVSSSIAWLLIIYIIPPAGIIIYLLFGELKLGKKRSKRSKTAYISIKHWIKHLKTHKYIFPKKKRRISHQLFQLCEHRQGIGAIPGNHIKLLKNFNDTIITLIHDITLAQKSIDIIFYIWRSGGLVDQVTQALITAAQRGVQCRLLLDSVGSINFFHSSYPELLKKSGIKVVEALNINLLRIFLRRMDLRQHKKIVLIDNYIAYTGSMNMVDPHFFKQKIGIGQWIDIMIRIHGPITLAMCAIFAYDWEIETGEHTLPHHIPNLKKESYKQKTTNYNPIQIIASGPGFPKEIIHQALLISLYAAHKEIIITTPYLIPSDDLLYALCSAAQRGVEVHIIIPKNHDSILVTWASKALFSELLNAGVYIHQFHKGLLHTKSILIDQTLSLVGTVNLDIRSVCINFEIVLVIDNKNFNNDLLKLQKNYMSHSEIINIQEWSQRPYWHKIIERLFYFFSPLL